MKSRRGATIALLASGICFACVSMLVWRSPKTVAHVSLSLRGIQTNSTGTLNVIVAATNRSSRPYGICFATQIKAGGDWPDPSLIRQFDAGNGDGQLNPRTEREFLVPVPRMSTPWRVVAKYMERPPSGLAKYWFGLRVWLAMPSYVRFLTTPEVSSNHQIQATPGCAFSLVLADWSGAPDLNRSAEPCACHGVQHRYA
jgi:hypothetical protein